MPKMQKGNVRFLSCVRVWCNVKTTVDGSSVVSVFSHVSKYGVT